MYEATLFKRQQIYIFVYALVGFVYHNESSVHGHETFKLRATILLVHKNAIKDYKPSHQEVTLWHINKLQKM